MLQLLSLIDLVLHSDVHLANLVSRFGFWTAGLLFLIVFCETGLVVAPFLPGDSLLFAIGALSATGALPFFFILILLYAAAILGDTVNYWIGHRIGPKIFERDHRWIKREHLLRTQAFYEKHGGKTIILARFVPIIRTFAPFVAGIAHMSYRRFVTYNIVGGLLWVTLLTSSGYAFGNIPLIKKNFSLTILAIIFLSILPALVEYYRGKNLPIKQPKPPLTPSS